MKKLLTLVALLGAASVTFGQGTINFFNTTKTTIRTNSAVGGPTTGVMNSALNGYYFALFAAPTTVTTTTGITDPNWTFVGLYATNTATGGVFSGGTPSFPNAAAYAAGSTVNVFAAGWSSNIGSTEGELLNWWNSPTHQGVTGWYGTSAVATGIVLGGGAIPAGTAFGTLANQAGSFNLMQQPVPEPSTFALAGLGAAAMLIFRRRKN